MGLGTQGRKVGRGGAYLGRHPVRAAAEAAEESFRVSQKAEATAWAFRPRPIAYYADNYTDFWRRAK